MVERAAALAAVVLVFVFAAGAAPLPVPPSPFSSWAAVVVAGDHEASDGNPSEGFDNARRDIYRNLVQLGFDPSNMAEFSTHPREYRSEKLLKTRPASIMRTFDTLARKAGGGCLLYISSHGSEDGLVVGNWIVPPLALSQLVNDACGTRPTVVVLSACFSGAMLPPLKGPNRMILTAARRDRTSFGCGQSDRYPYFDQCVLEVWKQAADFPDLAARARACVAGREKREHLKPASEPQFWIGPQALASLPKWH